MTLHPSCTPLHLYLSYFYLSSHRYCLCRGRMTNLAILHLPIHIRSPSEYYRRFVDCESLLRRCSISPSHVVNEFACTSCKHAVRLPISFLHRSNSGLEAPAHHCDLGCKGYCPAILGPLQTFSKNVRPSLFQNCNGNEVTRITAEISHANRELYPTLRMNMQNGGRTWGLGLGLCHQMREIASF